MNNAHAIQALIAFKSPEAVRNNQVTPKCDVYCLGIVILEIITGKFPSQYLNTGKEGIDISQWVKSAIAEGREAELLGRGGMLYIRWDLTLDANIHTTARLGKVQLVGAQSPTMAEMAETSANGMASKVVTILHKDYVQ
ncbi:hypothetical protein KY290_037067 [Solanum tuberosum]|uniref:Serine-threonine/tyrosine-protein kinase catalytic domain-containing protein n=1 Tax=Solanum tuberosum TaxID=4113 RepID=A0ABQ7TW68_SOLTU|nr:hypothetical protein KY290_037067 [Solanum tuberosum]